MNRLIQAIISSFILNTSFSQVLQQPLCSGYIGPGVYGKNFSDVFSFTINQASLAQLKSTALGLCSERRFLLGELNNYMTAFALVTSRGNFGMKMNYAGSAGYNELQFGIAHAKKLGKLMDAGVQFNYNSIRIARYGAASAISVEAGSVFHITPKLDAGMHINNPAGGKFAKGKEKLPFIYTMGFGYQPSELVLVSAAIIKEEDKPVNINTAVCYKFLPQLIAKAGISTASSSLWIGFGFLRKMYRLDLFTNYHPQLGISPGLLLLFIFDQGKERKL